jgi:molybdate transport system ATP-binding protein
VTLHAHLVVRHDAPPARRNAAGRERRPFTLDLMLAAEAGRTVALLGPNGAGKTTALRALAGLRPLDGGRVQLDGRLLEEPAAGVRVATERRPIGVVFQDYLLFGHLSALENVAFGLRARGADRHTARRHAARWLATLGLAEHAASRPAALSGGQAQRVALARAMITEPRLLLLDEPLAALDAGTRVTVRAELRRQLDGYPGVALLVTHDPLDAMVLADRLVVVEHGRVVQEGSPAQVAQHPRTGYVARLVGLNLYRGVAAGDTVELDRGGRLTVAVPDTATPDTATPEIAGPDTGPPDSAVTDPQVVSGVWCSDPISRSRTHVLVAFPPAAVALHTERPRGSARNVWRVRVTGLEQHGGTIRLQLAALQQAGPPDVLADVTPAAVAELRLVPGAALWAALKATEIRTYPA